MKNVAFIFPGQGAQYVGMGKTFYDSFSESRHLFQEADDLLKRNLSRIIFEGPEKELTETKTAQPAIYVVSCAILAVLTSQYGLTFPRCAAGLSLGEYTALTCAKSLSFQEGLALVSARSLLMHEACDAIPGGMSVILGLDDATVRQLVQEAKLPDDLWCANFNCPGQVVVSGTLDGLAAFKKHALEAGAKRMLPLDVHGAFHSGLMKKAQEGLGPILQATHIEQPRSKVAMNVTGRFAESVEEIRTLLTRQVTSSVLWHQCVMTCLTEPISLFLEIGCGKTLSGLNKRIGVTIPTLSIETVADLEQAACHFHSNS